MIQQPRGYKNLDFILVRYRYNNVIPRFLNLLQYNVLVEKSNKVYFFILTGNSISGFFTGNNTKFVYYGNKNSKLFWVSIN